MEILKAFFSYFIQNPKSTAEIIGLLVLCYILNLLYPKIRGFMGEFWVKRELKKLDKNKYRIFNDIMIKDEFGTHQIDHLVISKFGIFVIEVKNYNGLITGNAYNERWTQHLGKKRFDFHNPIYQNYGHIKSLSKLLNLDEHKFISIICFSNQARLKITGRSLITQVDFITSEIKKFTKEIIEEIEIVNIEKSISQNDIKDKNSRKEHVKRIKTKIAEDNSFSKNEICPKCKSKLTKREGAYGTFWGCSNFPKCKYTKKL